MLHDNRKRSLLALAQSFFYKSIFFTYGLVLDRYFKVDARHLPIHLLPFAIGNFLGPLLLSRFFDTVGRKPMIIATFGLSGVLLALTSIPFGNGSLTPKTLDICFTVIFFVASSAASAAYLTVSEIFPLEIRALAIALFYAIGTLIGGVGAPYMFGLLIESGSRWNVSYGYLVGSALMIVAAIAEWAVGIEAAGKSLEAISQPLQSESRALGREDAGASRSATECECRASQVSGKVRRARFGR